MVPIRIPTASVARIVKAYAQRLALRRTQKALSRESISYLLRLPNLSLYLCSRQGTVQRWPNQLDAGNGVRVSGAGKGCVAAGFAPPGRGEPRHHTSG